MKSAAAFRLALSVLDLVFSVVFVPVLILLMLGWLGVAIPITFKTYFAVLFLRYILRATVMPVSLQSVEQQPQYVLLPITEDKVDISAWKES